MQAELHKHRPPKPTKEDREYARQRQAELAALRAKQAAQGHIVRPHKQKVKTNG